MRDHVILLGWFVLTAIVNYLLRTKTAEEWEQLAQKSPRYAAFARMLRAIGLDPVKLIQAAIDFVRGEAQKRVGTVCEQAPLAEACSEKQQQEQAKDSDKA